MQLEQVKQFLECLGAKPTSITEKWVKFACPLARWTHKSGKDTNPSFGVTHGPDRSHFHCFTCYSGSLEQLLQTLELYIKDNEQLKLIYNIPLAREILTTESKLPVLPQYQDAQASPFATFVPWPDSYLDRFDPITAFSMASAYVFEERRITAKAALHFEVRWDEQRTMVVTPFRTSDGVLAGARGRRVVGAGLKHYDYEYHNHRNSHLVWYHEQCLEMPGPLVIVEGQFDCMRVWPYYPKVVAMLTSDTTEYKRMKLTAQSSVVLMLDNDDTGKRKANKLLQFFDAQRIRCGVITLPEPWKDPNDADDDWLCETFKDI